MLNMLSAYLVIISAYLVIISAYLEIINAYLVIISALYFSSIFSNGLVFVKQCFLFMMYLTLMKFKIHQ